MEISVALRMLDNTVSYHLSFMDNIQDQIRICPCLANLSFILDNLLKKQNKTKNTEAGDLFFTDLCFYFEMLGNGRLCFAEVAI